MLLGGEQDLCFRENAVVVLLIAFTIKLSRSLSANGVRGRVSSFVRAPECTGAQRNAVSLAC